MERPGKRLGMESAPGGGPPASFVLKLGSTTTKGRAKGPKRPRRVGDTRMSRRTTEWIRHMYTRGHSVQKASLG
jgi:hypothetical protein